MPLEKQETDIHEVFDLPDISPDLYQQPSLPLPIQEGPRRGCVEIPEEERQMLLDFATWTHLPPFEQEGRSAFVRRKQPLDLPDATIAAYKLKGVGARDLNSGRVTPPSSEVFKPHLFLRGEERAGEDIRTKAMRYIPQILIHKGIAEDGSFRPVLDPEKPYGGLIPHRGENEIRVAARLYGAKVPACLPITWARYPDRLWKGEPIECDILGLPFSHSERMAAYFEPDFTTKPGEIGISSHFKNLVERQFDMYDPRAIAKPVLKLVKQMAQAIGETLRRAHQEARVARFASHTGNYTYMPEWKSVFMHDFDSSIVLDDINPNARAISMIRDVESAIVGFFHSLAHSNLYYQVADPATFNQNHPIKSLLRGYFPELRGSEILQTVEQELEKHLQSFTVSRGQYPTPFEQQAWISQMSEAMSDVAFRQCFKLYGQSQLSQIDALPYGENELHSHEERYKRVRERLLQQRMAEIIPTLPEWVRKTFGM